MKWQDIREVVEGALQHAAVRILLALLVGLAGLCAVERLAPGEQVVADEPSGSR